MRYGKFKNNYIFNPDISSFTEIYNSFSTYGEIGNYYNKSRSAIRNFAKRVGLEPKYTKLLNEDQIQDIVNKYEYCTALNLAKEYSCSSSRISQIWRNNNKHRKYNYTYKFNRNYFEKIDSYDKAYFLGWIASDGCVYNKRNGQNTISLSINEKDKSILYLFKKYLECDKPITFTSTKTTKVAIFEIVSDKMFDDLKQYNIIPRKTLSYELKILDEQFMPHFIRGYFDGDGSCSFSKNVVSPACLNLQFSGFVHNLIKFQEYFKSINIDSKIYIDKRKYKNNEDFGELCFTNITTKYSFIKWLYKDCSDLYLDRKRLICDSFIEIVDKNNNKRYCDAINYYNNAVCKI